MNIQAVKEGHQVDLYWSSTEQMYSYYPTVRHRRRWLRQRLTEFARAHVGPLSVLDFGCGNGQLLEHLAEHGFHSAHFTGCDVSEVGIVSARRRLPQATFSLVADLSTQQKFHVIICSEVVEHTPSYSAILDLLASLLAPGGILLLTTQAGRIYQCDHFAGHTQHFSARALSQEIAKRGFKTVSSRNWGFPFFSLQKRLTNYRFDVTQRVFLEGTPSFTVRAFFQLVYLGYYLCDLVPFGPQIYLEARK